MEPAGVVQEGRLRTTRVARRTARPITLLRSQARPAARPPTPAPWPPQPSPPRGRQQRRTRSRPRRGRRTQRTNTTFEVTDDDRASATASRLPHRTGKAAGHRRPQPRERRALGTPCGRLARAAHRPPRPLPSAAGGRSDRVPTDRLRDRVRPVPPPAGLSLVRDQPHLPAHGPLRPPPLAIGRHGGGDRTGRHGG